MSVELILDAFGYHGHGHGMSINIVKKAEMLVTKDDHGHEHPVETPDAKEAHGHEHPIGHDEDVSSYLFLISVVIIISIIAKEIFFALLGEPDITIAEGHDMAKQVRENIMDQVPNVIDVTTLLTPKGEYVRQFLDSDA